MKRLLGATATSGTVNAIAKDVIGDEIASWFG